MQLRLLLRRLTVGMLLRQTLIPTIGQADNRRLQTGTACLKQREIRFLAFAKGRCQHFAGALIGNYLRFLRVTLLFAGVVAALFFLGRSHGHSVASINTISKTVSV